MGSIDRLLRKPVIQKAFCILYKNNYKKSIVDKFLFKAEGECWSEGIRDFSINISAHAFERWNERVGPIYTNFEELEYIIRTLFNLPFRITWLSSSLGAIDSDILFIYEIIDEQVIIKTFYGRKSLQPALNNFKDLRRYNYSEDTVNLSHTQELLKTQQPPLIPVEIVLFNGRTQSYYIEKYSLEGEKSSIYLKTIINKKIVEVIEIDLSKPQQSIFNRSVLYILHRLGHNKFVLDHLLFHKPEAVHESIEKFELRKRNYLETQLVSIVTK